MKEASIIMTVHNGEKYIEDSINSVISQNEVNLELIVIDDGSQDTTGEILDKFIDYNNITIIKSKKIGRAKALNMAIEASTTDYIANIDSDDLFHPLKIRTQLETMKSNNNIALLSTSTTIINDKTIYRNIEHCNPNDYSQKIVKLNRMLGKSNPINHSSVIIKKQCLEHTGGYDENRKTQLDYELWIRMARYNFGLYKIDVPFTYKRVHSSQSYEQNNRIAYLKSSIRLQKEAISKLKLSKGMYVLAYIRFIYGLLPSDVRKLLNRSLNT